MVFKGRFFSSKKSDTSSPDGSSNSPQSLGSNSPIRSDSKKKNKSASTSKDNSPITLGSGNSQFKDSSNSSSSSSSSKKEKEVKGKRSLLKSSGHSRDLAKPSAAVTSSLKPKKGVQITGAKEGKDVGGSAAAAAVSLSPIVASSLGLNKIKTRSGPLPQESFFGYASSKEKGSALGASNLSKPLLIGGDGGSSSGSGKKNGGRREGVEEKKKMIGIVESAGWIDNGSNSDSMSTESGPSRDQSPQIQGRSRLQNGESSSEDGTVHYCFFLRVRPIGRTFLICPFIRVICD